MNWMRLRTDEPELLDGDSVPMTERMDALGQLPLVNRFLGGVRAVLKDFVPISVEQPAGTSLRVLDVGCGSADIPEAIARWADASQRAVSVFALDRDAAAIELAPRNR